jgi:methionyl-tRNA formyltransferase
MHIVLFCATRRGQLVLQKLIELVPAAHITVFTFREDHWEPPFFEAIQSLTLDHGGNFFESRQAGSPAIQSFWESQETDIAFAVSWRYMIPPAVYQRPRLGTFVFHDSLLPAYRGFSPTVWAIVNGEDHTGVTLFEIAEAVDSGDIVAQERVPIGPDETIAEVMARVTLTYLRLFESNLPDLLAGSASRTPQDHTRATYTCKRTPEDNQIDWNASTTQTYNLVRAVSQPYPGAYTYLSGEKIRVWSAARLQTPAYVGSIPGRVVQVIPGTGSVVLTGDGALLVEQVQTERGQVECAANLLKNLSQTLGR